MSESALYPTIITTQLYEVKARTSTQLTADIDSLNTTIPVSSTSGFPSKGFISIGNETMYYSSTDATNFYVSRGYAGTAAAHNEGDDVKLVVASATINRQNAEIVAIQTYVGISGDTKMTTITGKLNFVYSGTTAYGTTTSSYSLDSGKLNSIQGVSIRENDIEFTPDAFNLDNDNPATEVSINGTSVAPRIKKIEFGNTDEADLPGFKMPRTSDGSTVTISFVYCSSTASSVFDIGVRGIAMGSGDTYVNNFGTAIYLGNITCSASTGIQGYTEKDIAAVSLGLTSSKINRLRVLGGTTCSVQILNMGLRWLKG